MNEENRTLEMPQVDETISKLHYATVRAELKEVWEKAKPYMTGFCRACKVCNSLNCPVIPTERAATAERNYRKLQQVKIAYETIYEGGDGTEIDTSISLFGHRFHAPIMSAPFGLVNCFNPKTHFKDDYDFTMALLKGTSRLGVFACTPDSFKPEAFTDPLRAIEDSGLPGIPTIKAWEPEKIQRYIRMADKVGCMAIAHDIDCIGLPNKSINGGSKTYPKSAAQLKEIFSITKTPFILKGVLSVRSAMAALESGASGIVVSNHAGNTLDQALSTVEVLPAIKAAVGDRMAIIVDGGVRHGEDVFKMLALGADAVMLGRPYIIAAEGGEERGVALYTQKIIWELMNAMRMSGCRTLKDITRDHVIITND